MRQMLALLSKINYEPFPVENNPHMLNELWKQNITLASDTLPLHSINLPFLEFFSINNLIYSCFLLNIFKDKNKLFYLFISPNMMLTHAMFKSEDQLFQLVWKFFKLILKFLLKYWGAERKKPLKHILFFPLDLRSLQSNDSEQETNGKAARLSWLPFYCHKFDPAWNIIFKDWTDRKLNSALSYHGTTPTLLSFFTISRTSFMPEKNLVYRFYCQHYTKNKIGHV